MKENIDSTESPIKDVYNSKKLDTTKKSFMDGSQVSKNVSNE